MILRGVRGENKIWLFITIIILLVSCNFIIIYYLKTIDHRDRLTAKRIEKAIATVVAESVGTGMTYDSGRILWTKENSITIRNKVTDLLIEDVFPKPSENGYYYYMYLESPYTVIKLPYKEKEKPDINLEVVTNRYMRKKYPKSEYVQVCEEVPKLLDKYDDIFMEDKGPLRVVCLNTYWYTKRDFSFWYINRKIF